METFYWLGNLDSIFRCTPHSWIWRGICSPIGSIDTALWKQLWAASDPIQWLAKRLQSSEQKSFFMVIFQNSLAMKTLRISSASIRISILAVLSPHLTVYAICRLAHHALYSLLSHCSGIQEAQTGPSDQVIPNQKAARAQGCRSAKGEPGMRDELSYTGFTSDKVESHMGQW